MSNELDDLAAALYNGFLPNGYTPPLRFRCHFSRLADAHIACGRWRKLAPQTRKGLGSWMEHFQRRYQ
jgi:hypothetical protein